MTSQLSAIGDEMPIKICQFIRVPLNKLDKKAMLWNMIAVIENQVSEATSARIE
jgi:hypothetical protein